MVVENKYFTLNLCGVQYQINVSYKLILFIYENKELILRERNEK
jgi:hypothetical protein